MSDIRLINVTNLEGIWVDLLYQNGQITEREALFTAVKVALLTDRIADIDEALPDPDSSDRRGWWGDTDAETIWNGWPIGCKNWLMLRAKITPAEAREGSTLARIEAYTRDALQPFIDQNICSHIDVAVVRTQVQRVEVTVTIYRGPLVEIELRFQYLWTEIGEVG
jgi:phage gp46-like protein